MVFKSTEKQYSPVDNGVRSENTECIVLERMDQQHIVSFNLEDLLTQKKACQVGFQTIIGKNILI